jgi:hypothetical protein
MRARSVILASLWLGGLGVASNTNVSRADAPQHQEGAYGGVTAGQGSGATEAPGDRDKRKHRAPAKDELTWIGFQAHEGGGGELFFQAPSAFTVVQRVDHGDVVLVLEGLHRQAHNTGRELDTRYFDTPIARVKARPVGAHGGKDAHKAGIEVRIAFKRAKDAREAQARTATEADGLFYAYLDFGADSGAPSGTAPAKGAGSGSIDIHPSDDADGGSGSAND